MALAELGLKDSGHCERDSKRKDEPTEDSQAENAASAARLCTRSRLHGTFCD